MNEDEELVALNYLLTYLNLYIAAFWAGLAVYGHVDFSTAICVALAIINYGAFIRGS